MDSDWLNVVRSAVIVLSLIAFLVLVVWAYSKRNREQFDEAARLPFEQDRD